MVATDKPPQFRGSDFAMRWEQGRWSEDRIMEALNSSGVLHAIPYGRSQIGPKDKKLIAEYWAKYKVAETHGKRPDLLVFDAVTWNEIKGQVPADPTVASEEEMAPFVERARFAVEAENSLWKARDMPDYGVQLPLRKLDIKAPRIWVKLQDWGPLMEWSSHYQIPIWVIQVFFDEAYAVSLERVRQLVAELEPLGWESKEAKQRQKVLGLIRKKQEYPDSRTGKAQAKLVYTVAPSVATLFGQSTEDPIPKPEVIIEDNGKIMPYVRFVGGSLAVSPGFLAALDEPV